MVTVSSWFGGGGRASGALMVLAFLVFTVGAAMWWRRQSDPVLASTMGGAYVTWERVLIIAGLVLNVVGLVLFDELLRGTGNPLLGRIGIYGYAFAALFALVYEAMGLNGAAPVYPLIVIYVVLAFLAQATIGIALLSGGVLPVWVGWLAVGWNVIWLVALPVVSPRDIYIPVLHHVVPLVVGMLLVAGVKQ
jgi:hypothetical protein